MKYLIEIYDIETEAHLEDIEIPPHRKKELAVLMGWEDPENEIYVYDLSAQQLKVLEEWTGRKIAGSGRTVQLAGVAD
jgi:hypothetical protein